MHLYINGDEYILADAPEKKKEEYILTEESSIFKFFKTQKCIFKYHSIKVYILTEVSSIIISYTQIC